MGQRSEPPLLWWLVSPPSCTLQVGAKKSLFRALGKISGWFCTVPSSGERLSPVRQQCRALGGTNVAKISCLVRWNGEFYQHLLEENFSAQNTKNYSEAETAGWLTRRKLHICWKYVWVSTLDSHWKLIPLSLAALRNCKDKSILLLEENLLTQGDASILSFIKVIVNLS